MEGGGFVETSTGNRVSRDSVLCGARNIRIKGKSVIEPGVVIRGDLANVKIGKYCKLSAGAVLRPAYRVVKGQLVFYSLTIGDNVLIEKDAVVEASVIGNGVRIGKGAVVSKRCMIKDNCWIKEGSVVPPDTVIPPFSIYEGCPAVHVGDLPECAPELLRLTSQQTYYLN